MPFTSKDKILEFRLPSTGRAGSYQLFSESVEYAKATLLTKREKECLPLSPSPMGLNGAVEVSCRVFESTGPSLRFLGFFFDIPSGQFYGGPSKATKFISLFDFYGYIQERGGTVNPALMAALLERYKLDSAYRLIEMFEELFPDSFSPPASESGVWSRSLSGMLYAVLEKDTKEDMNDPSASVGALDGVLAVLASFISFFGGLSSFVGVPSRNLSGNAAVWATSPADEEDEEEIALFGMSRVSSMGYKFAREVYGYREGHKKDPNKPTAGSLLAEKVAGSGALLEKSLKRFSSGLGDAPSRGAASESVIYAMGALDLLESAGLEEEVTGAMLEIYDTMGTAPTYTLPSDTAQVSAAVDKVMKTSGLLGLVSSGDVKAIKKSLLAQRKGSKGFVSLLSRSLGHETIPRYLGNADFSSDGRASLVPLAIVTGKLIQRLKGI